MFITNKYSIWYFNIISYAQSSKRKIHRNKNSTYYVLYHTHHILPRSLGGNNDENNLVLLTPREHYMCHLLLTKFTTGIFKSKMFYALFRFKNVASNSKLFENIIKNNNKVFQGRNNPAYNRIWIYDIETKKRYYVDKEKFESDYDKSIFKKGLLDQIGGYKSGRITINNGTIERKILPTEFLKYQNDGFKIGRLPLSKETLIKFKKRPKRSKEKNIEHSKTLTGRKAIINVITGQRKKPPLEHLEKFLENGWKLSNP